MRRVLSGEFTVVNQHLLADLTRAGLWTRDLKNELVAANGSVSVRLSAFFSPPGQLQHPTQSKTAAAHLRARRCSSCALLLRSRTRELVKQMGLCILSTQELDIPQHMKDLYKTVWEIRQRVLVDMAADRGAFIDQSQSFNVHMSDVNFGKLTSLHFYAWKVRFCVSQPACLHFAATSGARVRVCRLPILVLSSQGRELCVVA